MIAHSDSSEGGLVSAGRLFDGAAFASTFGRRPGHRARGSPRSQQRDSQGSEYRHDNQRPVEQL